MNKGFYKDLDTNFEKALELINSKYKHEDFINLLKNGNIPQKQYASMLLDTINNQEEANLLVANLTGCDGKIREAVAFKINTLIKTNPELSIYFNQAEVFADASMDINANICRLVIDSVSILYKNDDFATRYLNKLLLFINETFKELDSFIFRDKKYLINKQLFKLYWCLEAFKLFAKDLTQTTVYEILERASKEKEYTIREKVAQILLTCDEEEFEPLKKILKSDENYYVRGTFKY